MKEKITELLALITARSDADHELKRILRIAAQMNRPATVSEELISCLNSAHRCSNAVEAFVQANQQLISMLMAELGAPRG